MLVVVIFRRRLFAIVVVGIFLQRIVTLLLLHIFLLVPVLVQVLVLVLPHMFALGSLYMLRPIDSHL